MTKHEKGLLNLKLSLKQTYNEMADTVPPTQPFTDWLFATEDAIKALDELIDEE